MIRRIPFSLRFPLLTAAVVMIPIVIAALAIHGEPEPAPERGLILWERLDEKWGAGPATYRIAAPGGWLVAIGPGGLVYVPDPEGGWLR